MISVVQDQEPEPGRGLDQEPLEGRGLDHEPLSASNTGACEAAWSGGAARAGPAGASISSVSERPAMSRLTGERCGWCLRVTQSPSASPSGKHRHRDTHNLWVILE